MSKLTLSFKGKVLKVFPVLQGDMFIGSDPACTIRIDSLAVQARHARLHTQGTTSTLYDLDSPSGTHVNQARISEHVLRDGELIRVGKHSLSFSFEEIHNTEGTLLVASNPTSTPAATSAAQTRQVDPINMGQTYETGRQVPPPEKTPQSDPAASETAALPKAWLQILSGHNMGKTLSLNRALTNLGKPGMVTAVIARRTDGYFMSHLEGEHRPLIGDTPMGDKAHRLEDGQVIQIGNIKMQFYLE